VRARVATDGEVKVGIWPRVWLRRHCPSCGGNLYIDRVKYEDHMLVRFDVRCLLCAREVKKP